MIHGDKDLSSVGGRDMSVQEITVLAIVIIALLYIGFKIRRRFSPGRSCDDCSACAVEDCKERR